MCSQVGVIFGTEERTQDELDYIKWLFAYLLLLSERRGPHATGVAWLKADGSHRILKRPVRASEFVKDRGLSGLLAEVDTRTTWLAGHNRWQTRGDAKNNANNHPIRAGRVIGTHQGTVVNADHLFERLRLPRRAEVDSEIIFRLADATLADGRIDIAALKAPLALCRGHISAVMASKLDPETVVVVKGNKPLELRYHEEHPDLIYASDRACLDVALPQETGWQVLATRPMSILAFHCKDLPDLESTTFRLAGTSGKGGFERYVGPWED